jgi:hypothetical protein
VGGRILDVGEQPGLPPFPSEDGPPIADADPCAWGLAALVALLVIGATVVLMRVVTPAAPDAGRTT